MEFGVFEATCLLKLSFPCVLPKVENFPALISHEFIISIIASCKLLSDRGLLWGKDLYFSLGFSKKRHQPEELREWSPNGCCAKALRGFFL